MKVCTYCNKNKLKKGDFRCEPCAAVSIMNPTKRNMPVGGATLWKAKSGSYMVTPT